MARDSAETSNKSNNTQQFWFHFFISKSNLKKFKQFSLGDLLQHF
jgi:hypothetical protein